MNAVAMWTPWYPRALERTFPDDWPAEPETFAPAAEVFRVPARWQPPRDLPGRLAAAAVGGRPAETDSARWQRYLAWLEGDPVRLEPGHAASVRALWQDLVDRVGPSLRIPAAGLGGGVEFQFAWSYDDVYVDIDVAPDGAIEWFWKDRRTDEYAGSDDEHLHDLPEDLIRRLVQYCCAG